MNLLFYDIEVFAYDSLIVFKDINNKTIAYFWSNGYSSEDEPNGFEGVSNLISSWDYLVGYNNYYYDDKILTWMINGRTQKYIKQANDMIIKYGSDFITTNLPVQTLDSMQQIDVSKPSLKKIEGNMGRSIIESAIDFTIDRPLTYEEKETVLKYCEYDVESTIEVYKQREQSYFQVKNQLINMLADKGIEVSKCYRWNTTTMSAKLLMDKPITWEKLANDSSDFTKFYKHVDGIPQQVWDLWDKCAERDLKCDTSQVKGITIQQYGCNITFGIGGLHGDHISRKSFDNVKLLDVGSMYPSIIILLNALGEHTEDYNGIRKKRLEIKHKDKIQSNALKLILNSVYGNFKNKFSTLHNALASTSVCIYGQMALFDLSRELFEAGYTIFNLNTDGVAFEDNNNTSISYEDIWHDWETKWGLTLECDEFRHWVQKDVNNYIAIKPDDSIKVKGGEVNKYNDNKYFGNNDARIVHMALVNKLVYNIEPTETVMKHRDEPLLYQYVLKAGHTYKGTFDSEGNKMQNVNRVFALKPHSKYPETKLFKVKEDGGICNFPDVPEHMYLYNDDLDTIKDFKDIVDVSHYVGIVNKKLEGWQ